MKLQDFVTEKETRMMGNIPVVTVARPPFGYGKKHYIGGGIQANVYAPPSLQRSNKVVKIAMMFVEPENDAYTRYVNLVLDHPDNPFFPKIYFAKMYRVADDSDDRADSDDFYLMVELERLHEVRGERLIDVAR